MVPIVVFFSRIEKKDPLVVEAGFIHPQIVNVILACLCAVTAGHTDRHFSEVIDQIHIRFGGFRAEARKRLIAARDAPDVDYKMPDGVKHLETFEIEGKRFIRIDGLGVLETEEVGYLFIIIFMAYFILIFVFSVYSRDY